MQGHRLLRAVAVLILIVAFVYLVLALGGALWLGGSGFGSGWGTGWTGWLVLPLAGAAVMAGLTLMVFGLMLFFLARIDNNLSAAKLRPRVQKATAPALVAPAPAPAAPPAVTVVPEPAPPAAPVVAEPATTAPAVGGVAYIDVTPGEVAEREAARIAEEGLQKANVDEVPKIERVPTPPDETTEEPRVIRGEEGGEVVVPGGVLPTVEIAEEVEPILQIPTQVELPAAEAPAPDVPPLGVEAAPPDLVFREPVQIEVEAGEPEIGLPLVDVSEIEAVVPEVQQPEVTRLPAAMPEEPVPGREPEAPEAERAVWPLELPESALPEVELPRVEVGGFESQFETEEMVTPGRATVPAPVEEPPAAEARLPEIEITELAETSSEPAAGRSVLSEATGVPEPEVGSGVAAEPAGERGAEPALPPAGGAEALQAEIAALRAQLAELQAQMARPSAPAAPQAAPQPEPPVPDLIDPTDELPDEPLADASDAAGLGSGKLPGADEVARIAAEMNALKPKPDRPTPAATPIPMTTMRAPQATHSAGEDNLEIIMGVGPIYAKRLREVGITTYQQLAEASYEVLERVTRGNLERVIKEDWRGQALRLMHRQ